MGGGIGVKRDALGSRGVPMLIATAAGGTMHIAAIFGHLHAANATIYLFGL
jgi:hypothetical protein